MPAESHHLVKMQREPRQEDSEEQHHYNHVNVTSVSHTSLPGGGEEQRDKDNLFVCALRAGSLH